MLEPLDKDIKEFRLEKDQCIDERISGLQNAQTQLSEEARNLTTALKGDYRGVDVEKAESFQCRLFDRQRGCNNSLT